jgi:hypothetical protein
MQSFPATHEILVQVRVSQTIVKGVCKENPISPESIEGNEVARVKLKFFFAEKNLKYLTVAAATCATGTGKRVDVRHGHQSGILRSQSICVCTATKPGKGKIHLRASAVG